MQIFGCPFPGGDITNSRGDSSRRDIPAGEKGTGYCTLSSLQSPVSNTRNCQDCRIDITTRCNDWIIMVRFLTYRNLAADAGDECANQGLQASAASCRCTFVGLSSSPKHTSWYSLWIKVMSSCRFLEAHPQFRDLRIRN